MICMGTPQGKGTAQPQAAREAARIQEAALGAMGPASGNRGSPGKGMAPEHATRLGCPSCPLSTKGLPTTHWDTLLGAERGPRMRSEPQGPPAADRRTTVCPWRWGRLRFLFCAPRCSPQSCTPKQGGPTRPSNR